MVRILDSNASLLVLLLANFFLLELVDDQRWGALGSTLLAALALIVAISDPESGHRLSRRHWLQVGACVALAPLVLIVNSTSVVGLTYLLPVGLLVTATLPSLCGGSSSTGGSRGRPCSARSAHTCWWACCSRSSISP